MSAFHDALRVHVPAPGPRRWVYVPYDQLSDGIGPLAGAAPHTMGIVLVESRAKARRRPYHKRKLALVLCNLRHFAVEQAARGVAVRHVVTDEGYAEALEAVAEELGPLEMMRPAERELRAELAALVERGLLHELPHEGWLSTAEDFASAGPPTGPWRMDAFYRAVRRRTGWLMDGESPEGGRFSFDGENRKPWPGVPLEPAFPAFEASAIKDEVVALVQTHFADHPGEVRAHDLPATAADAAHLWHWAMTSCLPHFGPYEDAMSDRATRLFHTHVSELLNLHRLLPGDMVRDVATADLPLPSREGFVRQVLGWREFVRHVHEQTDGFRTTPRNVLQATRPLPPAFWGTPTGLRCLDLVVADVWRDGYSHHITRLMVLANLATLLDVDPQALSDWFWVAYADAYDWVVEPNVLAMGTFSVGELMTTKPYVSGAAYLHKMGDYCKGCRFHPKKTCPITPMYWAFLGRNRERLAGNHRMALPLGSERRRSEAQRAEDAARFEAVSEALGAGRTVGPER